MQYVEINGKPRIVPVYDFVSANPVVIDKFEEPLEGHFINLGGTKYIIWPFDKPKDYDDTTSVQDMVYIKNSEKIIILNKSIPWDELIGKTPAEIFDGYGLTQSEQSEIRVPEGEEKGIPGFEVIFAIAGLLAVAYVLIGKND